MTRAAKVTLATSIVFAAFTVWGVHYMQFKERENMYQGVLRDDARRKEKMKEREEELRISTAKREVYERVQPVTGKDMSGPDDGRT